MSIEFDRGVVILRVYNNTGERVHLRRISSISKATVATEFELEQVLISKIKLLVETN